MPIKMVGKVELDTSDSGARLYFELPKVYVENYENFTSSWLLSCTVIGFYSEDGQHICKGIEEEVLFHLDKEERNFPSIPSIRCFFDSEDSGNDLAKKYGIGRGYYVEVIIRRLRRALYKDRFFRGPKFIGYEYEDIFPGRAVEIVDSSFQQKHKDG